MSILYDTQRIGKFASGEIRILAAALRAKLVVK